MSNRDDAEAKRAGYVCGYGAARLRHEGPVTSQDNLVPSWVDAAGLLDKWRKGYRRGYSDGVKFDEHASVSIDDVAGWFGVSRQAVYSWIRRLPNTPEPAGVKGRCRYWRPSAKRDWEEWYVTDGPGRPIGTVYHNGQRVSWS